MLRFLEALNPWNSCFTSTDFEDALIDLHAILNQIDSASKDGMVEGHLSSEEKKALLENAFNLASLCSKAAGKQKPDKQLCFLLADILRQYALVCYEENYFATKQILVLALNLHLYCIGIFNECLPIDDFSSLEDLKKQCEAKPTLFSAMERSIASTSGDRCLTLAHTSSFLEPSPKKKLYSLAETARWLGQCYQNLDQDKLNRADSDLRFSQLFELSESLHLLIDDENSKHCLADLYYQAWPFMHLRKKPLEVNEACQLYEKALFYDGSQEMQARIANGRFLILFSHERKKEALPFIQKALSLAERLNDSDKHRLLLANIYYNYSRYLMDPEALDLEQAEVFLSKACNYAAKCRAEGKDHLQFALYDLQFAEFKFVMGEFQTADEIVERSLITLQKQPQSQHPYLFHAEALKSLISKTKNLIPK